MRGPLVYCIEQTDQAPDEVDVTFAVDPDAGLRDVWRGDLMGGTMQVVASGFAESTSGWDRLYRERPAEPRDRHPVEVASIPYFLWGNRQPGLMEVWIPVSR